MLITGASAGIGAALAREYASRGWNLVLVARREERLHALAEELKARYDVESHVFGADLFSETAVPDLMAVLGDLQVDGLINNAGYGHPGTFLASEWEAHRKFNHLMTVVPVELTRALLPAMAERGFGRVMQVASLAGHMPGSKGHTLYSAVKSYLIKFSESLNAEMSGSGVHVSALCPGFVLTEFHDVNGTREGIDSLPDFMIMKADVCAKLAADALEADKAVFISGRVNRFLARLNRWAPWLGRKVMNSSSSRYRKAD
ncbi:dehydrogenase [Litorimonas cladophorae]|uniref:Dehydrogenase n=2 Tax=Litorimonas cladophorae TaxID=1220491 RepID=A0A918KL27_9PROT|nr:dehydrogenase [Litorimonas cladophorae]